jgi:hypothetical protein
LMKPSNHQYQVKDLVFKKHDCCGFKVFW